METITQTFQNTFTLEWALLAMPVALVLSFLVNRVAVAGILAFFAIAFQHIAPAVWPLIQQNASSDAIMAAATAAIEKGNPLSLLMEIIAFAFFIAVFSLTRQDMFRHKPDDASATH